MATFAKTFALTASPTTFTDLNIPVGAQDLTITPIANIQSTLASFNIAATTVSATEREFMACFGLVSNTGAPESGQNDKVTLTSTLSAQAGSSDVWSLYSVLTMEPSSGVYNAQGYELDFNNFNKNLGNSGNLTNDFSGQIANGLSITGAGQFSSTTAMLISSQAPNTTVEPQWNRGITATGKFGVCPFQEWSVAPVGFQFDGVYSVAAINLTAVYGNQGAGTLTALFMKNNQSLAWQNAAATSAVSDKVDGSNNRYVGIGAAGVFSGAALLPVASGLSLGGPSNFWGNIYSNVGIVSPSDLRLKTEVTPLAAMSAVVMAVSPIAFRWQDQRDDRLHYGFDAAAIRQQFPEDFAGHIEHDGVAHLAKDQLISVLWQANREMLDRITALEAKTITN